MSEELLIRNCAPTLAGLKTGSIYVSDAFSEADLRSTLWRWNRILAPKGLRVILLRRREGRGLIYLFRPGLLRRDLHDPEALSILRSCGYAGETYTGLLLELQDRLTARQKFPHEIGLFLGYPPEDVRGFLDRGAGSCILSGCWKVYGNADNARACFARFKKCTDIYCRLYSRGYCVEQLAVTC